MITKIGNLEKSNPEQAKTFSMYCWFGWLASGVDANNSILIELEGSHPAAGYITTDGIMHYNEDFKPGVK